MDSEVIYMKVFLLFFAILLYAAVLLIIVKRCKLKKSCTHRIMSEVSYIEKNWEVMRENHTDLYLNLHIMAKNILFLKISLLIIVNFG